MSHEAEAMKLIECRDIGVRFGGLKALSDVSLAINDGEVLGIAGPNGAGKTTLFNVISGHVRPASGEVIFRGQPITGLPPHKIFQLGLARTFQLAEVIGSQDIYANVLVGAHFARDTQLRTSLIFDDESHAAAQEALRSHELEERSRDLASKTSLYQRKLVMLASALAHAPQAVLLDEPVSGLTPAQAKSIVKHIERVRSQGTTVVVIEHVMRVLMAIAERLVILDRGKIIFDGSPERGRENEEVQRLYLGSTAGGLV